MVIEIILIILAHKIWSNNKISISVSKVTKWAQEQWGETSSEDWDDYSNYSFS